MSGNAICTRGDWRRVVKCDKAQHHSSLVNLCEAINNKQEHKKNKNSK